MTYIHKKIDLATGEEIAVPYTKAELDEVKANEAIEATKAAELATKAAEKAAVLAKLGLTADEVAALLS